MRTATSRAAVGILAATWLCGAPALASSAIPASVAIDTPVNTEPYVARINGRTITRGELEQVARFSMSPPTDGRDVSTAQRRKLVEFLIDRSLILDHAETLDIQVSEAEIDREFRAFRERFGDEATYRAVMEAFKLDVQLVRETLRHALTTQKVMDLVAPAADGDMAQQANFKKWLTMRRAESVIEYHPDFLPPTAH